jgi:GAF domain-containing protein
MLTGADPRFDDIVRRAAAAAGTEVAAVSLVGENIQIFKAAVGFGVPYTSRDVSFCAYVILGTDPLVVLDAVQDPRFADNALVLGPPYIRFYLGLPVFGPAHVPFGALFVLDSTPWISVSPALTQTLWALAEETSRLLAAPDASAKDKQKDQEESSFSEEKEAKRLLFI